MVQKALELFEGIDVLINNAWASLAKDHYWLKQTSNFLKNCWILTF
tara:strand:+ start:1187 stop:1324 length:138 start_codon:yes stop_codon:yes gene_type:complete